MISSKKPGAGGGGRNQSKASSKVASLMPEYAEAGTQTNLNNETLTRLLDVKKRNKELKAQL